MNKSFIYSFKEPQLYDNWFLDINPLNKINIIIALLLIPIFSPYWQVSVGVTLIYILIAVAANSFQKFFGTFLKLAVLIGAFFFILRALFYPGETPVLEFGFITITKEGIDLGILYAAIMVAASAAIVLITVVTQAKDLIFALEKIGAPHATSYIILSSFQTIIDLGDQAKVIMDSQRARGIETEGNILTRFRAFIPVLTPLFLGALTGAEEKAIAMDARAFSAPVENTHLRELRPAPVVEKILVVLLDIVIIGFVIWGFVA